MAWCSRLLAGRRDRPENRRTQGWLRVGVLGCLIAALGIGIGLSCVAADSEYCETRVQCPYADTPLGPMQLFCHSTRHVCLLTGEGVCVKDEDCGVDRPHCDVDTNACTPCRVGDATDKSCARFLDRPLCGTASDGSGTTLCLACRNNLDCPSATPICDSQQCRKCAAHSDCEGELHCDDGNRCIDSLVCIGEGEVSPERAGSCAQNGTSGGGRVVYVNNLDPICMPPSTPPVTYGNQFATPLCNLESAFERAQAQSRRYIRVVGKKVLPLLKKVEDGAAYSFIGAPAKAYRDLATVEVQGLLFDVHGTSWLTLDQLDILERTANATVISCSGNTTGPAPRFTLRRSILRGSTTMEVIDPSQAAVAISNCTAVIDSNVIGVASLTDLTSATAAAHGQGLSIGDARRKDPLTSYLIQNNLIAGNIGVAMDLQGTSGGTPSFVVRFNTIVGNGRNTPAQSGAVFCAMNAKGQEFSHSIVWNNSLSAGEHSQFFSASWCGVRDLVVGTGEAALNNPAFKYQSPQLDESLHLIAGQNPCCIDQVTAGSGEILPALDLVGTKRPQGPKWDIGAFELRP